jgi:hypothetical protein
MYFPEGHSQVAQMALHQSANLVKNFIYLYFFFDQKINQMGFIVKNTSLIGYNSNVFTFQKRQIFSIILYSCFFCAKETVVINTQINITFFIESILLFVYSPSLYFFNCLFVSKFLKKNHLYTLVCWFEKDLHDW